MSAVYALMGCNLRVGKFDVSASNMIFASPFHQAQVNGQWKRIRGLQHTMYMGQLTNQICTKASN